MTRQDQLFSMNGATLIQLADKLGVKAACNKTRTQLKEKKENVVNRILEAEKKIADAKAEKQIEKAVEVKVEEVVEEAIASDGTEYTQVMKEIQQDAAKAVEAVKTKKKVKSEKKVDKHVIDSAISVMDELHVLHKESWQNKGTAMYVGSIRVFECWKRMERMRINYNPELTSLDDSICVSKEEDKREKSHLSVTCYVVSDKVADAVKMLVKNLRQSEVDELNAKKAERKSKKTAKQTKEN